MRDKQKSASVYTSQPALASEVIDIVILGIDTPLAGLQSVVVDLPCFILLNNDEDNDGFRSPVNFFDNDFKHSAVFMHLPFPINASNLNNVAPRFVDAVHGNYRLRATSPLIDQGNNAAPGLPATDQEGQPRIVGVAVDLGAYESD